MDLPLKNQNYIHEFFERNQGKEFIGFTNNWDKDRVKYLYIYTGLGRNNIGIKRLVKRMINEIFILLQKGIGYDRTKKYSFYKSANWFSITNELAEYVVSKKEEICKKYKYSILADEVFLQTIVCNSKFKENVYGDIFEDEYSNNLRYIDWERGNPYIFRESDFENLMNTDKLFARKFDEADEAIDNEIINRIYADLSNLKMLHKSSK